MRILQVVNSLAAGGAEIFVASLAAEQSRAGHKVEVFTYSGAVDSRGSQLEANLCGSGVPHISPVARSLLGKASVPLRIAREVRHFQPDVVHSHLEQSDLFVGAARYMVLSRRPVFLRTVHSVTPDYLPLWVHRLVAHAFDCGVACGRAPFETYTAFGRMKRLIENGIDLQTLKVTRARPDLRADLRLSEDDAVLISVGSFGYRYGQLGKGQDLIIRALAEADCPNLRVVFLGDGQLRTQMQELARSLGVDARCRFVGTIPDPGNYFAMADAAVMPSRFEGLSIAAIEAACSSLPLILSDVLGFASFSSPATLTVPVESIPRLAEAMVEISLRKSRYAEEAGRAAIAYRARFGIEAVASKYVELYQELHEGLQRRGAAA